MQTAKYTEQQILCGLQECWHDFFGTDDDEIFDADMRIDQYLKEHDLWDDFDLYYLVKEIEEFFHFMCSEEEWKDLFGINPPKNTVEEWEELVGQHLTFRVLAQFIAERALAISFRPVIVIDRECAPAGAFFGIQEVVKNVAPDSKRFAPSTKIIDVIRGKSLEKFWTQLKWFTRHEVPELSATWKNAEELGCLVGLLGVPAGILIYLLTENSLSFVLIPFVCALIWWAFSSLYKNYVNPLPSGISTFRDLAMLIAAQDCTAVRTCKAIEH